MAGFLEPDFSPANTKLQELALDSENFFEAFDLFSKRGLPLFVIEGDSLLTKTTGNLVAACFKDEIEQLLPQSLQADLL
jgi:hypothetical protein